MKQKSKQCENCKRFKALYMKKGLRFKKTHLGICLQHKHIGDKENYCPYWRGKKI